MPVDLLNPTAESEKRMHKKKRLVQSPNSFFMDVKCPGCFAITTVFRCVRDMRCGMMKAKRCATVKGGRRQRRRFNS